MPSTILISLGDLRQSETSGVSSSSGYFDPFPDEVIERVFLLLPPPDLISALRLNLRLNKVIRDSKKLQYYFTLQTSGLVDGNKAALLCDKLLKLRDREKAWRSVDLSRRLSVPMDHTVDCIYGLSGGILFCGKQSITTEIPDFEHLKCLDLTTCDNGSTICKDSWHQMIIPGRIAGIGYALQGHDLIGIVGAENERKIVLHLRQYSTDQPHPLASQTEIPVAIVPYPSYLTVVIEISGPFVVLLLSQVNIRIDDLLLLIHWRTGEIIIREESPCRTYLSFTFLTRNLLFLPNSYKRMFEIVKIPNSVALGNGTRTSFKRLAFLHLRILDARFLRTHITCSADLIHTNEPHSDLYNERFCSEKWAASRQQSFFTDLDKTIIRVEIWATDCNNTVRAVEFIVHRKALIDVVNAHVANYDTDNLDPTDDFADLDADVVIVPWETWTQDPEPGGIIRWDLISSTDRPISRCRPIFGDADFGQADFGQRIASVTEQNYLLIKDFNHYAVKQALATLKRSGLSDSDSDELFDVYRDWNVGPVRLNDHTLLRVVRRCWKDNEDEETSSDTQKNRWLPYAETMTKLDEKCDSVILDGERIICVQENRFSLVAKLNIYTL